jgi:hypothetical protein
MPMLSPVPVITMLPNLQYICCPCRVLFDIYAMPHFCISGDRMLQDDQSPRPQTADRRPQTADRRPQTADRRPQTADRRPQTYPRLTYSSLLI